MKSLDIWLQNVRIDKAKPFIPPGSAVLDIGAADGVLFRRLGDLIGSGVGIDPDAEPSSDGRFRLVKGLFPQDLDTSETFDVITALAIFEHLPDEEQHAVATACFNALKPGGRCILTIPSPAVDHILKVLVGLKIIDGMHEGEHHGFDVNETPDIFRTAGFTLHKKARFQLTLNNLFVFDKPAS